MSYKPGIWAKASVAVTAIGWFISIARAAHAGEDTSDAAFLDLILVFLLAVFPMVFGTVAFYVWPRSQRSGDIAFACCMVIQGILLATG